MKLAQNVCPKSRSSLKLGHLGQKLGHQVKSKENLVNIPKVTFFKQSSGILLKMFVLMIFRSSSKLDHLGKKKISHQISHRAIPKENLVNTPEVTFFK